MSGFSAEWLALREPADHAARNGLVAEAVRAHFAARSSVDVVDLGCGSGSNLRGSWRLLPPVQRWTLVDHDPALLGAAREALAAWADTALPDGDGLNLRQENATITVRFRQADLAGGVGPVLDRPADLVTAAALFDLASPGWIAGFAAALGQRRLPLYTVLTYDGQDAFAPPDPLDGGLVAAFAEDMRRDKGLGPAAGPDAARLLAAGFRAEGYRVATGDSPWDLDAASPLAAALADGFVSAVAATGRIARGELARWRELRRSGRWRTGHTDLFAAPG